MSAWLARQEWGSRFRARPHPWTGAARTQSLQSGQCRRKCYDPALRRMLKRRPRSFTQQHGGTAPMLCGRRIRGTHTLSLWFAGAGLAGREVSPGARGKCVDGMGKRSLPVSLCSVRRWWSERVASSLESQSIPHGQIRRRRTHGTLPSSLGSSWRTSEAEVAGDMDPARWSRGRLPRTIDRSHFR